MKIKKNWFYYLTMSFAIIGLFYILICGFISLGEGQEYPYFPRGMLLMGIFFIWMFVHMVTKGGAKIVLSQRLRIHAKHIKYVNAIFIILILFVAVALRVYVIGKFPIKPESDYKTYYEIAVLLKNGTLLKEGKGYCNYIAMFPHVMGYCYILQKVFAIVGTSVLAGQYLNVFFSVATVFVNYKIAKKLGGWIAGYLVLILCAFWSSQVLYITMLSAEYSFTFFLSLGMWLFVTLVKDYDGDTKKSLKGIILHLILGGLLALTAAIRPMAIILLVAIIITLLSLKIKLPPIPKNNIPLTVRMLEKGWIRCMLIILPYMLISGIITTNIEMTINKTLPSASTSFGYNLLVGLNTESKGGWNDEDAALLYASMEQTNSASQAHITCRNLAFQRLLSNPKGICNLFINKYELLWGNDDYGATWNIAFLKEQGNLTQEKSDFLYGIRDVNNILYLITIFFALISLIYLWKEKGNGVYVLVLMYLGTVVMHLFVESQNRYHYFVLEIFMVLGGMGIQFMYEDAKQEVLKKIEKRHTVSREIQKEEKIIKKYHDTESKIEELRKEAFANVFDMQSALQNGNICMTVSQAYQEYVKDNESGNKEVAATKQKDRELVEIKKDIARETAEIQKDMAEEKEIQPQDVGMKKDETILESKVAREIKEEEDSSRKSLKASKEYSTHLKEPEEKRRAHHVESVLKKGKKTSKEPGNKGHKEIVNESILEKRKIRTKRHVSQSGAGIRQGSSIQKTVNKDSNTISKNKVEQNIEIVSLKMLENDRKIILKELEKQMKKAYRADGKHPSPEKVSYRRRRGR